VISANDITKLVRVMLAPIRRALFLTVSRGVVKLVNESFKLQNVQIDGVADETQDNVEHFQEYGFTSRAAPGAEVLLLSVAGNRGHTIAACVTDRRARPKGLVEYDVCLFTDKGARIYLDAAGDLVNLGAKAAADFVALAGNTESRLAALESLLASHTHIVTGALTPPSAVAGTAAPIAPPPVLNVPPAPVAATKVKAT
jgi:phage baseplate assembly protein V